MPDSEVKRRMEELVAQLAWLHNLIKGETDVPGLLQRIERVETAINGDKNKWGLNIRVDILWNVAKTVLAITGVAAGIVAKPYFIKLLAMLK